MTMIISPKDGWYGSINDLMSYTSVERIGAVFGDGPQVFTDETVQRLCDDPRAFVTPFDVDTEVENYLACALWTETPYGEEFYDDLGYVVGDFSRESVKEVTEDVISMLGFMSLKNIGVWPGPGHDLFLTRNGHGAGFWDRGLPGGDDLTLFAKALGSTHVFIGVDERLWFE